LGLEGLREKNYVKKKETIQAMLQKIKMDYFLGKTSMQGKKRGRAKSLSVRSIRNNIPTEGGTCARN